VYRLAISKGPRVVAAIPASGKRGTRSQVTFIGYGLKTGKAALESINRQVHFVADSKSDYLDYQLETKYGNAPPFKLLLSSHNELAEKNIADSITTIPSAPIAITGVLEKRGSEDRYRLIATKGEMLEIHAQATAAESPLDTTVAIFNSDGKQVATSDDANGKTDARLTFKTPKDGAYEVVVGDVSSQSGRPDAIYRLSIMQPSPSFEIVVPDFINIPIGGKADLKVTPVRLGEFDGTIELVLEGLPQEVTATADAKIEAKQKMGKVTLTAAENGSSKAFQATLVARATLGDKKTVVRRHPILIARTMKPRATVSPVDKDGGRTVHRGTTYPAAVIIERIEDFKGPVVLQMAAKQGRHRQGITSSDVIVPPGVTRTVYPVYCPEWLETDRTSRMVVNAVTKVADSKGNVRYLSSKMDGRITMSLEGALLKIASPRKAVSVKPGETFIVPISIACSPKLPQNITLVLEAGQTLKGFVQAESVTIESGQTQVLFKITISPKIQLTGSHEILVRATALQAGKYPAVSQTTVEIDLARKR
jgi:hypothetical protein